MDHVITRRGDPPPQLRPPLSKDVDATNDAQLPRHVVDALTQEEEPPSSQSRMARRIPSSPSSGRQTTLKRPETGSHTVPSGAMWGKVE